MIYTVNFRQSDNKQFEQIREIKDVGKEDSGGHLGHCGPPKSPMSLSHQLVIKPD